jgi:Na+-transporting NADH:ubiquinone oxidoreductase subunit NqrB
MSKKDKLLALGGFFRLLLGICAFGAIGMFWLAVYSSAPPSGRYFVFGFAGLLAILAAVFAYKALLVIRRLGDL